MEDRIHLPLTCCERMLTLDALAIEDLDTDILVGTPFVTTNDIAFHPSSLAGSGTFSYGFSQFSQTH